MHLAEERLRACCRNRCGEASSGPGVVSTPRRTGLPGISRQGHLPGHGARFGRRVHAQCSILHPLAARQKLFSGSMRSALGGYRADDTFHRHAARADRRSLVDGAVSRLQDLPGRRHQHQVDRASMAHSLEVREPLMDHELIEWVARLSPQAKVRGGRGNTCSSTPWNPVAARCAVPAQDGFRRAPGTVVPGPLRSRLRESLLEGR